VREVATMDEHAQIEGISRNAFMVRALEERVARQLVDREIRVLFFGVKALRKRLKEQYPEI
jgi:uncharacterized protein (DUF1778 family)